MWGGEKETWGSEKASKWRIDHNKETEFEIRSIDVFLRAINILESHPDELWSFAENPKTLQPSKLKSYWEKYGYMDSWRKILN